MIIFHQFKILKIIVKNVIYRKPRKIKFQIKIQ